MQSQIKSRFIPALNLNIGTFVLTPTFTIQKRISKKLQLVRKESYQIIEKPTDVTYNFLYHNKKIVLTKIIF